MRWRRRAVGGTDVEYVEFWEGDEYGWSVRFRIQSQGAVAGRGLFAARRFATGENLTVYMGADLGDVGTMEGEGARTRLAAIHRADHVMQIGRRYVDGRDGSSGAQFINTDIGKPRSDVSEEYMVATVDEIRRRLSECGERPTHTRWEVESAANARDLRRGWRAGCRNSSDTSGGRGGARRR